MEYLPLDVLSF